MASPITRNTLFYGDNLPILRAHIPDESIDLIYLDPPFNSNRTYNVLFKEESGKASDAQIAAFDDTWHWGEAAEQTYHEMVTGGSPEVGKMLAALRGFIGSNQMMAYLVMMAARLVELHRVLKPTGGLYLHCDPTASHYLKIILDTIFGPENFRNEIAWKRTQAHNDPKRCGSVHDIIFYYAKDVDNAVWYGGGHKVSEEYLNSHYKSVDNQGRRYQLIVCHAPGPGPARVFFGKTLEPPVGRHWTWTQENIDRLIGEGRIVLTKTGGPRLIQYAPATVPLQDMWTDIDPVNSQAAERLGYPTQKPLALLERIIETSSKPGDWVLDPFCGCGTAIAAAEKLGRHWIGIDITHLSIALQKYRLKDSLKLTAGNDYDVIGEPCDLASAKKLANDDRFQFQYWALSKVEARPIGGSAPGKVKKGKDYGIDGIITFLDGPKDQYSSVLIQVKSGHVKSGDMRDLRGVIEREGAAIGVMITLEPPTKEMTKEALTAGYYKPMVFYDREYPRIQILTIDELLNGAKIQMPPTSTGATKKGEVIKKAEGTQGTLGI